jgi:hypothetical protein
MKEAAVTLRPAKSGWARSSPVSRTPDPDPPTGPRRHVGTDGLDAPRGQRRVLELGTARPRRNAVRAAVEHPFGEVVDPLPVGAGVVQNVLQGVVDQFRRHREDRPARGRKGLQSRDLCRVGADDGDAELGEDGDVRGMKGVR